MIYLADGRGKLSEINPVHDTRGVYGPWFVQRFFALFPDILHRELGRVNPDFENS